MVYYVIFTDECPKGWTTKNVDDGRFMYVTDTTVDGTAGATTGQHRHNFTGVAGYWSSGAFGYYANSQYFEYETISIVPAGFKVVLCSPVNKRILKNLPSGAIIVSDTDSCPTNYTGYSDGNSKFVYFTETDADAGDTVAGSLGSHTHTGPVRTASTASQGYGQGISSDNSISAYTSLYHHKLMLCKRN